MKRNTPLIIALTLAAIISPIRFWGQNLDYNTFINRVMQHNLDYAAAKLDLSVSQADLSEAKKLYSDPTLSAEYGNNSDWDIAMGQSLSFELGKTISLGKPKPPSPTPMPSLPATSPTSDSRTHRTCSHFTSATASATPLANSPKSMSCKPTSKPTSPSKTT